MFNMSRPSLYIVIFFIGYAMLSENMQYVAVEIKLWLRKITHLVLFGISNIFIIFICIITIN